MNNYRNTEAIIIPVQNSESSSDNEENDDDYDEGIASDDTYDTTSTDISTAMPISITSTSVLTDLKAKLSHTVTVTSYPTPQKSFLRPGSPTGKRRSSSASRRVGSTSGLGYGEHSGRKKRRKRKKRKFRIPGSHSNTKKMSAGSDKDKVFLLESCKGESSGVEEEAKVETNTELNSGIAKPRIRINSAPVSNNRRIMHRKEMALSAKLKLGDGFDSQNAVNKNDVSIDKNTPLSVQRQRQVQDSKTTTLSAKNKRVLGDGSRDCSNGSFVYKPPSADAYTIRSSAHASLTKQQQQKSVNDTSAINKQIDNTSNLAAGKSNSAKSRSMLLALSKESYNRTLPPMLHSQSMNFPLGSVDSNNKKPPPYDKNNIKTAVSRYGSAASYKTNFILQREVANPRCIPIVPDFDNTRINKLQSASILCKTDSKIGSSVQNLSSNVITINDVEPKSILKANAGFERSFNGRIDRKKSVRFSFSETDD